MLRRGDQPFTTGQSKFLDTADEKEQTAKIYIKFRLQAEEPTYIAQLDTGAAWSFLHADLAEELGLLKDTTLSLPMSTRLGEISGYLVRVPILLVADEGLSLDCEATVFVSRDWAGGNFLGYGGLLPTRSVCN